jgi:hypothetical protein
MIGLNDLVEAAKMQQEFERVVTELEENLKICKEQLARQSSEIVPNMMIELGISEFKLDNGYKVSVSDDYVAKLPAEDWRAFQWLRQNGLDGIIKSQITVSYGKGEDEMAQKLMDWMSEQGILAMQKTTIHPQTLKAFVKERISAGRDLPLEFFGAQVLKKTVISK